MRNRLRKHGSFIAAAAVAAVMAFAFAALAQDPTDEAGREAGNGLAGLLAKGGGYGLSAVLLVAIYFREKKTDALVERIIGLTERQSTVLAEHNLNVRRHNELIERSLLDRRGG